MQILPIDIPPPCGPQSSSKKVQIFEPLFSLWEPIKYFGIVLVPTLPVLTLELPCDSRLCLMMEQMHLQTPSCSLQRSLLAFRQHIWSKNELVIQYFNPSYLVLGGSFSQSRFRELATHGMVHPNLPQSSAAHISPISILRSCFTAPVHFISLEMGKWLPHSWNPSSALCDVFLHFMALFLEKTNCCQDSRNSLMYLYLL